EFPRPARDGVLVEAHHGVLIIEQVPRAGATTKGIHSVPGQVPPPGADRVPRRTATAAAQSGEAGVFHLIQMEDAFHADQQREDTGQQALPQGAEVICETFLGRGQPVQGLRHQQERPRVLRPRREKGGGGSGTGWLGGTVSTGRGSAGVWPALGRGAVASARVARSRPNFLQKWCKATVETRTPQVPSMKS